jgi:hypothetical protein
MTDSLVGLNLDTFEEMKEQFADKEKEYIKKLKKYQDQAELVIKHVDRIIEQMEIQNLVLKRVYEFVGEFSEMDEQCESIKKMIEGLEECEVLGFNTTQKWALYKAVSDQYNKIHQDYISSSLSANCDGNSAIFDPTL